MSHFSKVKLTLLRQWRIYPYMIILETLIFTKQLKKIVEEEYHEG